MKKIKRLAEYSAAATVAVSIDFILLASLVEVLNIYYLSAAAISFITAHSVNFYIDEKWGFKDSKVPIRKAYPRFIGFGMLGLAATIVLLSLIVTQFDLHYLFAKIIVVLFVGSFNFIMNSKYSFKIK